MAFDHTLAMSQSDTSVSRIDPFSSSLATAGRHSSTALSLSPTSLTIASLVSATSPCVDSSSGAIASQSFPTLATESNGTIFTTDTEPGTVPSPNPSIDVDPQILEALRNKDRIYVLKLGETFEALIKDRRIRVEVSHSTSYQRLLVHRCSAYYKLQPESDPLTKALYVMLTSESKIPERRICELVPPESPTQPAFKIMKREPRSKSHSHTSSLAGDEGDLSDVEPSESGSLGGQSYNTNSSSRKRMTIEEREAAYNEARSRIFMGFEEKEKGKELSASSSTMSVDGSTSSTGRGYMGDTDDAVSLPPVEGDWSMPPNTFHRDPKRRGISASTSSRGLRSGSSFHGNSSGNSSRNSRAASPSFSYPTLYEPTPQGQLYDAHHYAANPGYHPTQYGYPYPPNQGPNPSYLSPYPYYPSHYSFQSPPMSQHNPSDCSLPTGPDPFPQHHQMSYIPPYGWPPQPLANQPPIHPHPHSMHPPIPPHHQNPINQIGPMPPPPPPPPQSSPYQPYIHPPHAYPYSMNPANPYYPTGPPGQQPVQGPPPPQMALQPQPQPHPGYDPRVTNPMMHPPLEGFGSNPQYAGNVNYNNRGGYGHGGSRAGLGNGIIQPNARPMSNRSSSSSSGNSNKNTISKRSIAPSASRPTWNSGTGVPMGGFPFHIGGAGMNDSVGPRFSSLNRRTSGNTSSGGNSCASSTTNGDDVSSIASSSTTSSSSRRTYTSTTSSQQHPLPPRPDWAVGIKAQPTLAGRHHDHSLNNSRNMSPISPPISNGQNSPHSGSNSSNNHSPCNLQPSQQPLVSLQATDFPPLTTSAAAQEKRVPVATGAWAPSKPVLPPNLNGNLLTPQSLRGEETGNDRFGGKPGENYTPKLARRPVNSPGTIPNNNTQAPRLPQVKTDSTASLAGQVALMTLGEEHVASGNGTFPAINTNPSVTTSSSPNAVSALP